MDFYDRVGIMALGSRLRRLGERLGEEAGRIYAHYGTDLQPRWFPVFFVLAEQEEQSVSAIAEEIGHTHASVSQIVTEMVEQDYAVVKKRKTDGRKSYVALSARGREAVAKVRLQCQDVGAAVSKLMGESSQNLWEAVADCEQSLTRRPLLERVLSQKQSRESTTVVEYQPCYAQAFKLLNQEWIETHFAMEEADRRALEDPEGSILRPGGHILVALHNQEPAGVCALVPHGEGCFELAKMAVSPRVRGQGIGLTLGQAALEKARSQGAQRVYLESNTVLTAAISLYRKLGFREVAGEVSPYRRCNIQMEVELPQATRRPKKSPPVNVSLASAAG